MLGTLRLLLAVTVVTYHARWKPLELNTGVIAVAVFYVISGYVITALFSERFFLKNDLKGFYWERTLRIAPQYYFYLGICIITFYVVDLSSSFFSPNPISAKSLLFNISLIPLGLYSYFPTSGIFGVIPPAASLGVEVIFYLLFPFIFRTKQRIRFALSVSTVVLCAATWDLIPRLEFSYYSLPGVFIFFALGHCLEKEYLHLIWPFLALAIANFLALVVFGEIKKGFNKELLIGLVIGLTVVRNAALIKPPAWDRFLGNATYGCFLGHYPVLVLFDSLGIFSQSRILFLISVSLVSIVIGAASYLIIEKPTVLLRRKIGLQKNATSYTVETAKILQQESSKASAAGVR